jgi:hypothetical protein
MTEYEFMTAKRNGFALCGKRRLNSSLMILHWMVLKLDGRQGLDVDVNVLALTRVFDLEWLRSWAMNVAFANLLHK